jgi:hypothetical protein
MQHEAGRCGAARRRVYLRGQRLSTSHLNAPSISRRGLMALGATLLASASFRGIAFGQENDAAKAIAQIPAGGAFTRATVVEIARAISKAEFSPPPSELPDPIKDLTYEQYAPPVSGPMTSCLSSYSSSIAVSITRKRSTSRSSTTARPPTSRTRPITGTSASSSQNRCRPTTSAFPVFVCSAI